jgi:serine/threonine-protein kinase
LGAYQITAFLGAGGMGEVYKAFDTRLDRLVAIKILPTAFAADPQFRERFNREARSISQLDHPHICALHDVGDQDGAAFLVMQYLEGETLEQRLKKGALPIDRALQYAIQIADALAAAHRTGIVHRDLKPGNIMLTRNGATLLDFGLAKAAIGAGVTPGVSTVLSGPSTITAEGAILGTVQYMAPEQIEGRQADARTDIFAFGCVLFEMLTGRKAFEGKSQASLLGAILKDPAPQVRERQPLAPASLDRLITTCLAKEPDARWQSAADLERELEWIANAPSDRPESRAAAPASTSSRRWVERAVIGALCLVAGAAAMRVVGGRTVTALPTVARVAVPVSPADSLPPRPSRTGIALSPDGRTLAFVGRRGGVTQLYLRGLDREEADAVAGTNDASNPFFSPDGRWIGYWQQGALRRVSVDGGPSVEICKTGQVMGASWGSDDAIVFAIVRGGLLRVPATGGSPESITTIDGTSGEISHRLPSVLPDASAALFTVVRNSFDFATSQVAIVDLKTRTKTKVLDNAMDARYIPSGHLVFARLGAMYGVPFDARRREVIGPEVGLVRAVTQAANAGNTATDTGAMQAAFSTSGTLAYVPGGLSPDVDRTLVWIDRAGAVTSLPLQAGNYGTARLSPDQTKVAVDTRGTRRAVWVYDLARGSLTAVSREGTAAYPIWSPDGLQLIFAAGAVGNRNLYRSAVDGSAPPERLTTSPNLQWPISWARSESALLFVELTPETEGDIWELPMAKPGAAPRPLIQTKTRQQNPELSPDGKWIAYTSEESGRDEVYVQSYPALGPRAQVSTKGGVSPAWSRDGHQIYFVEGRKLFVADVTTTGNFTVGLPKFLFDVPDGIPLNLPPARAYDVSADGRRFLAVRTVPAPPDPAITEIRLVLNWMDELRAKAPAK